MEWRAIVHMDQPSVADFESMLASLRDAWVSPRSDESLTAWALSMLDLEGDELAFAEINDAANELKAVLKHFSINLTRLAPQAPWSDAEQCEFRDTIDTAELRAHLCQNLLKNAVAISSGDGNIPLALRPPSGREETTKKTPFQRILVFALDLLCSYGYRRKRDSCFREIRTVNNVATQAYEEVCPIMEFLQRHCASDDNSDEWADFFSSKCSVGDDVCKQLQRCVDPRFPELEANRFLFSFRNGFYFADQDMFYPHDRKERWHEMASSWKTHCDRMNFRMPEEPVPPSRSDVAIKFFDTDFPEDHWKQVDQDVPTPEIERILDAQDLSRETKSWVYAHLGRLIWPMGRLEKWERVMFIKGVAQSGKSTICNAARKIFPPHDVANIGHESTFMLSALMHAKLWMCTEVRRTTPKFFREQQGDFQSMITGGSEGVSVAIKHKEAKTVAWESHGLLCGNEVFDIEDAGGSILRRMAMVEFKNPIASDQFDLHLEEKIFQSFGHFLLKINRAYLRKAKQYGNRDLKDVVSLQMKEFNRNLECRVDTAARFLKERSYYDLVTWDDLQLSRADHSQVYMKWTEFTSLYFKFLESNGLPRRVADDDHFGRVLYVNNLQKCHDTRPYRDQPSVEAMWLFGIGFRDAYMY